MKPNKHIVVSLFLIALLICPAIAAERKKSPFPEIFRRRDLVISSLRAKIVAPNRIQYWWTITNVGSAPANLEGPTPADSDNVILQAYLSSDTIWNNAGDVPAGGTYVGHSPGSLAPHASRTGTFTANFSGNIAQFNYLTLKVDFNNVVSESNENNNTAAVGVER